MKWLLLLTLFHGSAATADGFATKHWEHTCPSCTEIYPTRVFIDRRPTWSRMAPWGAAEVGAGYLIGRELRKHHKKWWWVPQAAITGIHVAAAVDGFKQRHR